LQNRQSSAQYRIAGNDELQTTARLQLNFNVLFQDMHGRTERNLKQDKHAQAEVKSATSWISRRKLLNTKLPRLMWRKKIRRSVGKSEEVWEGGGATELGEDETKLS
jgi:hypothetical protein